MSEENTAPRAEDAETEFRRRLAAKLAARGYAGQELEVKVAELLRKGVKLRLDPSLAASPPAVPDVGEIARDTAPPRPLYEQDP